MTNDDLPLAAAFRDFAAGHSTPVDGGLLVARIIDPATDSAWVRGELRRLADAAGPCNDGAALVAFLHETGFAGAEAYYSRDNSSLEYVLRKRRGIPISLALVVLGVAEVLGIDGHGVNFPQHFLVSVGAELVDPFQMAVVSDAQRQAWLSALGLSAEQAFAPASARDIVLRMLNNLRVLALQRGEHALALDYSGYQILIAPDPFPFHLDRVDLWLAAGVPAMARHELDRALELAPNAALKAELARRRMAIADAPGKLH